MSTELNENEEQGKGVTLLVRKESDNFPVMSEQPISLDMSLGMLK